MKVIFSGFLGENRALHPKLLPDAVCVKSNNQKPGRGDLAPWKTPLVVATIPTGRQSIYRMGRDAPGDANYWLSWITKVYAVRGMSADDTTERTYYTGDGTPKVTDLTMALAGTPYPTTSRPLGIPAPSTAPNVAQVLIAQDTDIGKYRIDVPAASLASIAVGDQYKLVLDGQTDQTVTLTAGAGGKVTSTSMAADIDALSYVHAVAMPDNDTTLPGGVRITGDTVKIGFRFQKSNGTSPSYAAADVTYTSLGQDVYGAASTAAQLVINQTWINSNLAVADHLQVTVNAGAPVSVTLAAGSGTLPPVVTTTSLKSALAAVTGITTVEGLDVNNVPQLTITTSATGTTARIRLQKIVPLTKTLWVDALTATAVSTPNPTVNSYFYLYTFVNDWGWESAPSPPSAELECPITATKLISGFSGAPAGNYNINRIRVYRTQPGSGVSAPFFFLREITIGTTSTQDDNRDLGETLPSLTWLPAPDDLSCLTPLWNGMMAGISGNSFRLSEPYEPYAWPIAYDVVPPDSKPVAIAYYGQTMIGLTTARPIAVAGSSSDSMDSSPIEVSQGCIAAKSAVSMGTGVVWASMDGLCSIGFGRAPGPFTTGFLTREDWQALNPASVTGLMYEGMYFGSYDNGSGRKGFFVDPNSPQGMYFLDTGYQVAHFDELQDQLYVYSFGNIMRWDAGTPMTVLARSKQFRAPKPISFACAEVVADSYPVTVRIDALGLTAAQVTAAVAANPALTAPTATSLRYTKSVTDRNAFRLPGGFTALDWQIELENTVSVQGMVMATSMDELKDV